MIITIGGVLFDMPYGITGEEWDKRLDAKKMDRILKQVAATTKSKKWFSFNWHSPEMTTDVLASLKKNSYQEMQHLCWYKPGHFTPTPVSSYTSAWEMGTIGFHPSRIEVPFNVSSDARERHNHISVPSLTTKHKDSDGEVINSCQKPPELAKWIVSSHCFPNTWVLVLGAGAGGEILGALQAGCNVVAVEKDKRQFVLLEKIILQYRENERKALDNARNVEEEGSSSQPGKKSAHKAAATSSSTSSSSSSGVRDVQCNVCGGKFDANEVLYSCEHTECANSSEKFHEGCTSLDTDGKRFCVDHAQVDI